MNPTIWLLQCVTFVDLLAVGLIVPMLASHVRSLGAGHIYVGLMGSIYSGCQLASGPLIGSLSDLKGRKIVLLFTLLICGFTYAATGFTESLVLILLIRAVLGLFKQTQILSRALVPDYEKNTRKHSEIYGKMAAISGVGITLGPLLGGYLGEYYPKQAFKMTASLVGILFVVNAGIVFMLPKTISELQLKRRKPRDPTTVSVSQAVINSFKESALELYKIKWSEYGTVFFIKGLLSFGMSLHYCNYLLYLKSTYGLSPKAVGYIVSFQGSIGSICSYCMVYINNLYINDKDYSVRNFHVFSLLTLSILGMIYSYNVYFYAFWLIPLSIGNAVGRLVNLEMVLKIGSNEHRAALIGASNSVRSIAGVIAPLVAGLVEQYSSISNVMYVVLFVNSIGILVSYQYKQRGRRRKQD